MFAAAAHVYITVVRGDSEKNQISGARVIILQGEFSGREGVCLGETEESGLWAVSPDESDTILLLAFERDFGLLIDLSSDPRNN